MSVGFYLLGELQHAQLDPDALLRRLEKWILRECHELAPNLLTGFLDEKPCLFSNFHPAGEEVEICLADPKHITVSANTSTVGPGYHIYLCDMIHRWTDEFSVSWKKVDMDEGDTAYGDETNYFFTGKKQKVFEEMESWLHALTGSFFDGTMDSELEDLALCMPMNVRFESDSLAITQLGPRDKDWLYRMSKRSIDYREFFSWYDPGLSANYYLGRALVQMWSDVRWRKPANDNETVLLKSVSRSLEIAYGMNSSLKFPWNEWNELLNFLGDDAPDLPFVKMRATGPGRIGYRRRRVKTSLPGNWWIEAEGSFSSFESDGDGTLSSVDPPREIWFTSYSFSAENPDNAFNKMRDEALSEKHELVHEDGKYVSVADIGNEGHHYLLKASNIGVLCRSICTLVFEDSRDREWAIRVWRSLKPPITPPIK
jgi:hypothetical protein